MAMAGDGVQPGDMPHYTRRQGQFLAFIYYYTKLNGQPPAVHQMVVTLGRRGLIQRTPGQSRSIRLLLPREALPDLE